MDLIFSLSSQEKQIAAIRRRGGFELTADRGDPQNWILPLKQAGTRIRAGFTPASGRGSMRHAL